METKLEAESEQKPVAEKTVDSKPEETIKKEPTNDSTLQRLTPALIVSVSILLSSGILSATSFAKSKDMTPQVRNFYYQLPPPGPYMSNLAMPQQPMNQSNWSRPMPQNNLTADQKSANRNRPQAMMPPAWVNQPPQMNRPQWARPMPPWMQNRMQNAPMQQNNLTEDQKAANKNQPQAMVPPAWVRQPPQMNRPQWARPMPPWMQNRMQNAPMQNNNNLTEDQKAANENQPQAMVPPAWVRQPPQMNHPQWTRPMPPWMQNGTQNGIQNAPMQQNNLTADQKSKQKESSQNKIPPNSNQAFNQAPPAWVQRQQQMMPPPGWTRPAPPWMQQPARH